MSVTDLHLQVQLQPSQGDRFQPTGFPDLGPAEYYNAQGRTQLLVESPQSMANRLERVVWDPINEQLIPPLKGLPYVRYQHPKHGLVTSVTEAHRLASAYLQPKVGKRLENELAKRPAKPHIVAPLLFRLDPCCLLHGVFFPSLGLRMTRLLSAFIEASDVSVVDSGGVKFDRLDPSGPTEDGKGNVLFRRREYCSERIIAYFQLDLIGLQELGLSSGAQELLKSLTYLKIHLFLQRGLRLRSACHLRAGEQEGNLELPELAKLEKQLPKQIAKLLASTELEPTWELTD